MQLFSYALLNKKKMFKLKQQAQQVFVGSVPFEFK